MVYKVTVPILTNSCDLKAGDELILRKSEAKAPSKVKVDDWRTDIKTREQEEAKAQEAKSKGKAKAKPRGGVLKI